MLANHSLAGGTWANWCNSGTVSARGEGDRRMSTGFEPVAGSPDRRYSGGSLSTGSRAATPKGT